MARTATPPATRLSRRPLTPSRLLLAVVPAWVASRLLAVAAYVLARHTHGLRVTGDVPDASGWWVWDAGWYASLAKHGYDGSPAGGLRFFPLLPLLGRGLGAVFGGDDRAALLVVANLSALGFGIAVFLLARRELNRSAADSAVTSAWLTLVAPGAVVLALAYTEPLAGLLAASYLLLLRQRPGSSSWWVVVPGVLSGLVRPTGILLSVAAGVELLRGRRSPATLAAAVAPLAGTAAYLAWSGAVYGNPLLPYTIQQSKRLRGTVASVPLRALATTPSGGFHGWVNVTMVVVAVALLVVAWRALPASIAMWATLVLLAVVTEGRPLSLARYLSADFPLLIAAAVVVSRWRWGPSLAVAASAAGMVAIGASGISGQTVL